MGIIWFFLGVCREVLVWFLRRFCHVSLKLLLCDMINISRVISNDVGVFHNLHCLVNSIYKQCQTWKCTLSAELDFSWDWWLCSCLAAVVMMLLMFRDPDFVWYFDIDLSCCMSLTNGELAWILWVIASRPVLLLSSASYSSILPHHTVLHNTILTLTIFVYLPWVSELQG